MRQKVSFISKPDKPNPENDTCSSSNQLSTQTSQGQDHQREWNNNRDMTAMLEIDSRGPAMSWPCWPDSSKDACLAMLVSRDVKALSLRACRV